MNDGEGGAAQTEVPAPESAPTALVLVDLGAPATPDEVKPFLRRAYGDLPRLPIGAEFQKLVGALFAAWRGPHLVAALRECPAGAFAERPQLETLGRAICQRLGASGPAPRPYLAFRYGSPDLTDALTRTRADGGRRVVALYARPFASVAIGGALRVASAEHEELDLSVIDRYDEDPAVRAVWAELVRESVGTLAEDQREGAHLLFVLQGLPIHGRQDPALPAAREFAEAVRAAAGLANSCSVAYQTGVDPRAPLLPAIEEEIEKLARAGRRAVVVIPIGHCCESLSSLWELDVRIKALATAQGLLHFVRAPSPAGREDFTAALEGVVRRHLEQMQALRS